MMLTAPFAHPETLIKAAQALEHKLPKTGHRLMNLPTPHGPADLVHVQINHRPEGYPPAHLGYMVTATGRADILATLMDQGPMTEGELKEALAAQGVRLDRYNFNLLHEEGLISRHGKTGKFRAHRALSADMASIRVWEIHPVHASVQHMAGFAAQVNTIKLDGGAPVIREGATSHPKDTAVFLSTLGGALEGITHSEHHDIGHARDLRYGWVNCANVR